MIWGEYENHPKPLMKRTLELREQKRATLDRECDLLEKVMGQGMLMEG